MRSEELDHIIVKSFHTEPDFHLPDNFADKLTMMVTRRDQLKSDLHNYLYLTAILAIILAVVSVTYYFVDKNIVEKGISYFVNNTIPILYIVIILNFILFADRVLLPLLFRRSNKAKV
jgi:hypothetical protein